MIGRANVVIRMIPVAVAACNFAWEQRPPTATLTVDLGNTIEYREDIYNPVKFATSPKSRHLGAKRCDKIEVLQRYLGEEETWVAADGTRSRKLGRNGSNFGGDV